MCCCRLPAALHTSACRPLFFFFFNDTATTEIYTLSLHDALPIFQSLAFADDGKHIITSGMDRRLLKDRKSTRLNSSHMSISYAVFCLKKKNKCSGRSSSPT